MVKGSHFIPFTVHELLCDIYVFTELPFPLHHTKYDTVILPLSHYMYGTNEPRLRLCNMIIRVISMKRSLHIYMRVCVYVCGCARDLCDPDHSWTMSSITKNHQESYFIRIFTAIREAYLHGLNQHKPVYTKCILWFSDSEHAEMTEIIFVTSRMGLKKYGPSL